MTTFDRIGSGGAVAQLGGKFIVECVLVQTVTRTIELSDDLAERIEGHLEDDETIPEFVEELVAIYEQEGRFLQEGA